jgi:hypothetical protein
MELPVRRGRPAVTGPREPEADPWHPTPRLRWCLPHRGVHARLQQLWQRDVAFGPGWFEWRDVPDWIEWRDVPVETAD